MLLRCFSVLLIFVLTSIAQASLLDSSKAYFSIRERSPGRGMGRNEILLRDILQNTLELDSSDRLTEPLRTKRCRWKLCGTGRRFRYIR